MNSAGVQVGVVSFGSGCARPGVPGGFARTLGAIDWINQMICKHSPKYCPGSGGGGGGDGDGGGGSGDIPLRVRVVHDKYPKEVSVSSDVLVSAFLERAHSVSQFFFSGR